MGNQNKSERKMAEGSSVSQPFEYTALLSFLRGPATSVLKDAFLHFAKKEHGNGSHDFDFHKLLLNEDVKKILREMGSGDKILKNMQWRVLYGQDFDLIDKSTLGDPAKMDITLLTTLLRSNKLCKLTKLASKWGKVTPTETELKTNVAAHMSLVGLIRNEVTHSSNDQVAGMFQEYFDKVKTSICFIAEKIGKEERYKKEDLERYRHDKEHKIAKVMERKQELEGADHDVLNEEESIQKDVMDCLAKGGFDLSETSLKNHPSIQKMLEGLLSEGDILMDMSSSKTGSLIITCYCPLEKDTPEEGDQYPWLAEYLGKWLITEKIKEKGKDFPLQTSKLCVEVTLLRIKEVEMDAEKRKRIVEESYASVDLPSTKFNGTVKALTVRANFGFQTVVKDEQSKDVTTAPKCLTSPGKGEGVKVKDEPGHGISYADIVTAPQCLISTGKGDEIIIEEDVLLALAQREKPAVVVGIAGKYRSGKSYLMNRLAGKSDGFSLGSTIQSQTKGIWIWVMDHPRDPTLDLILLDTEGLRDVEKADGNHDAWIFCLIFLLSSTLVFNVMGILGQDNIDMLSLILELSTRIQTKAARKPGEDLDFDEYCPYFIMALRDFTAELEANGKALTPDEYLEHCLKVRQKGKKEVNDTVAHIRKYFKRRSCFIFPQPATRRKIRKLGTLQDSEIEEDFVEESKRFVHFVLESCEPKTTQNQKQVHGRVLAEMVKIYVDSIHKGDVPCIERAVDRIAETENERAITGAVKVFQKLMESCDLPKEVNELEAALKNARELAISYFYEHVYNDQNEKLIARFMKTMNTLTHQITDKNMDISEKRCKAALLDLGHTIEQKLQSKSYFEIGGHEDYLADVEHMRKAYFKKEGLGATGMQCFEKYMESREILGDMIKNINLNLSKSKEKIEEQSKENEELKRAAVETKQSLLEMNNKLNDINKQMEVINKENEHKFISTKNQLLQKQKAEGERHLTDTLEKKLGSNIASQDHRYEEIDAKRVEEISKLEKEGQIEKADKLKEEKEVLRKEHEKEKRGRIGFWEKFLSKFKRKKKTNSRSDPSSGDSATNT